jgi:hypothetical protein
MHQRRSKLGNAATSRARGKKQQRAVTNPGKPVAGAGPVAIVTAGRSCPQRRYGGGEEGFAARASNRSPTVPLHGFVNSHVVIQLSGDPCIRSSGRSGGSCEAAAGLCP